MSRWCRVVFVLIALMSVQVVMQFFFNTFCWDRQKIFDGEIWRVLTGHMVHLSWQHWGGNALGLSAVIALFSDVLRFKEVWITGLMSSTFLGLGLLWFTPDLQWYCGMSGVLHSLFVVFSLKLMLVRRSLLGGVLLLLAVIKVSWEMAAAPLSLGAEAWVIHEAHLAGLLVGSLTFFLLRGWRLP